MAPWLSDRGMLRLMSTALAVALIVNGVTLTVRGNAMSVEEPREPCVPEGTAEGEGLHACTRPPATSSLTAEGLGYVAAGGLEAFLGLVVLVYAWLRWSPRVVQPWLPKVQPEPAPEAATGDAPAADLGTR